MKITTELVKASNSADWRHVGGKELLFAEDRMVCSVTKRGNVWQLIFTRDDGSLFDEVVPGATPVDGVKAFGFAKSRRLGWRVA